MDDFDTEKIMLEKIKNDIKEILIPKVREELSKENQALFNDDITYHINPTGKFVIGGPHGDTGLTGRKINRRYLWWKGSPRGWEHFRERIHPR